MHFCVNVSVLMCVSVYLNKAEMAAMVYRLTHSKGFIINVQYTTVTEKLDDFHHNKQQATCTEIAWQGK